MHVFVLVAALVYWAFDRSLLALCIICLLILAHEFGHAALVRRFGGQVLTIDLHALGGECSWAGDVTAAQRAWIAWGGVLAQGVILVAALLAPWPQTYEGYVVRHVLVVTNAWMIGFNLLPIPPLDGSKCWVLIPMWWRDRKARRLRRAERAVEKELRRRDALDGKVVPDEVRVAVSDLLRSARDEQRDE